MAQAKRVKDDKENIQDDAEVSPQLTGFGGVGTPSYILEKRCRCTSEMTVSARPQATMTSARI